jgi:hypothetical protein
MPEEIPSNDNHFQLPGGGIVKVAILTLVILLVERRLGQAISWLALLEAAAVAVILFILLPRIWNAIARPRGK